MRTLIALAALSLAAVATAQPAVRYVDVPGVPYDAQISDAGVFAVATSTTYRGFVKDGGTYVEVLPQYTPGAPATNYVSAFFDDRGCLSAYAYNREFFGCGTTENYLRSPNDLIDRLRHTPTGAAYVQGLFAGSAYGFGINPRFGVNDTWTDRQTLLGTSGTGLSALSVGGVEYGGLTSQASQWYLHLSVDGGQTPFSHPLSFGPVNEVHLFEQADGVGVLVGTGSDLRLGRFSDGGATLAEPAVVLTGAGAVTGVAFSANTGDAVGSGFGMAVVQGATTDRIYSPIPDPARPAQTWVPHGNAGLSGRAMDRVTCSGAALCVITTPTAATQNVVVYENASAPRLEPFELTLDEDAAPVVLRADAGDPDGDPIYVSWGAAPAGAAFLLEPGTDPHGLVATLTPRPGVVCGTEFATYPLALAASDGWAAHTTRDGGTVRIRHTLPPGAPVVEGTPSVPAGSDPITLSATAADGGCPATGGMGWTELTTTGYRLDVGGTGTTATFHAPETVCAPVTVRYQVVANDGFLPSAPSTLELQVQPWGKPDAAYPDSATVTQTAGTRVTYVPAATHLCAATAGFPGVQTAWTFAPDQLGGAVVDVGGTPANPGVVAPQVGLFVPDCRNGTFVLGATNTVIGSGATSAPSTLTVSVETQLTPVATAVVTLSAAPDAGGQVTGAIDSSANCEAERGLQADVVVVDADGGEVSPRATVPVPSDYALGVDAPCTGGAYLVRGQLVEADGGRGLVAEEPVQLPPRAAILSAISGERLLVSCGDGARATLTSTFAADSCQTHAVTWQQLSGPAVEPLAPGATTTVQTRERGFGELIGSEVVLRASTNEGGIPSSRDVSLRVEVDPPFVRVEHETETPLAEEGGILGVRIRLTNDTACDVAGAVVREALDGLRLVPGSVKVNGTPAAAEVVEGELRVPGVALPAHTTVTVVYSARPALLSRAQPVASATVNDVKVSPEQGLPEVGGRCGCGATSGGTMLLGTVLLLLQRLRRRGVRQRP